MDVASVEDHSALSTLGEVAKLFPIAERRSYLNNASIGPMSTPVMEAVNGFLEDVRDNGRNNYPHWCEHTETQIKSRVARLIGCKRSEIAFVKNTTEGLCNVANGLSWRSGDNVVLPDREYPSNVYCWTHLARHGVEVRWVKSQDGRYPVDAVRDAINERTRIVSISPVQFSTGFRHDLALTSELCRQKGVLLNLDAIQWVGSMALDLSQYHVDFMSAGGHKWLLAPIGTGIFYCNQSALDQLTPPNVGYHSTDKGEAHLDYGLVYRDGAARFEEALINFPGIWGLDAAVKLQLSIGSERIEQHILGLVDDAAERLQEIGFDTLRSPVRAERSGLLCFSRSGIDLPRVEAGLRDAGVDLAIRDGRFRISPSYYNRTSDIDRLIKALRHLTG